MNEIIRSIEAKQIRSDLPQINVGDTVRVWVKVVEGNRERLQAFEGTVIAKRNGGIRETFTVRRVSYGIGVERTFPINSPRVDHVDLIHTGRIDRESTFNTNAVGNPADSKCLADTAVAFGNNSAFESLQTFTVAFNNLNPDPYGITDVELGQITANLFSLDGTDNFVHGLCLLPS